MPQTLLFEQPLFFRSLAALALVAGLGPVSCVDEGDREQLQDRTCSDWAPGFCGRPDDDCFAAPGTCEQIYGGPRQCMGGNWSPVASCDGGGDDGGGECAPWSSGRCRMPDGCYAAPSTCADVYGGPRVCDSGNWLPVASCGGGDGGDGGDSGGPSDAPPLPSYGIGLDPGAMVNGANGHIWFHDLAIYDAPEETWRTNFDLMEMSGAQYVRVNFIRPAGWTEQAFLELYDPLIDEIIEAGMIPYALVGGAAVATPLPEPWVEVHGGEYVAVYNEGAQRSWINNSYAPAFEAVVDHFGDRILAYESYNEPDNWFLRDNNDDLIRSPHVQGPMFAEMVDAIYDEVKDGGAHPDVVLITGPLVGHDHGGYGAAASYLKSALDHGQANLGWGGSNYPFDGVGYHIYVDQSTGNGWSVQGGLEESLDAIHEMLEDELGETLTQSKGELWISEFGWATPGLSDANQSGALQTSFNYFRSQSWRVRMASWYQVGDTPSEGGFGLMRPNFMHSDTDQTRFKAAWGTFIDQAALSAP